MTGLDTNVVLRYLLQADPKQTNQVNRIIDRDLSFEAPGFISVATVLEIVWVLRSLLKLDRVQIAFHIEQLLAADTFEVQNEQQVFEASFSLKRGLGEFEDALIGSLNLWAGCSETITFDRGASRLPHFRILT